MLPTVGGSYFISDTEAVRIILGLGLMIEPDTDFAFSLAGAYRSYHTGLLRRVAPYFEAGAGFGWIDEVLVLQGFISYGAEYFFNDQLSLGGSVGLQLDMVDGTDLITICTGRSGIELTVYW